LPTWDFAITKRTEQMTLVRGDEVTSKHDTDYSAGRELYSSTVLGQE